MSSIVLLWCALLTARCQVVQSESRDNLGPEPSLAGECPAEECELARDDGCVSDSCEETDSRNEGSDTTSETMEESEDNQTFFSRVCDSVSNGFQTAKEKVGNGIQTAKEKVIGKDATDKRDEDGKNTELIESPENGRTLLGHVYDTVSNGFQTAKEQIIDKPAKMTADILDKFRDVIHEELSGIVQLVFSQIGRQFSSPGTLFYSLSQTAMTATLIVLCIILSYIFWRFFSLLFIFAFNCSIFLCHHFFGPKWVFDQFFWITGYAFSFLNLMAQHYFITSGVIVFMFLYSVVISPYLHWRARREERHRSEQMSVRIAELCLQVGEIEARQIEMLKILKELKGDRFRREE